MVQESFVLKIIQSLEVLPTKFYPKESLLYIKIVVAIKIYYVYLIINI